MQCKSFQIQLGRLLLAFVWYVAQQCTNPHDVCTQHICPKLTDLSFEVDCMQRSAANVTWKEVMKAGLLLVSLLAVGLPSAALGLEMSGALGRLSVSFLPALVRALLTAPGLTRFACAAAAF